MISYYTSKHPGLLLYITLVTISVLSFLFFEISAPQIGLLSILWGAFILMRTLSLYEVNEHFIPFSNAAGASKDTTPNHAALPHDLLRRMNGKENLKRGLYALTALHGRTILWFILAISYTAYNLYLAQNALPQSVIIQNLSLSFMIGAAFWAGQTYAYSNRASKLLLLTFGILFGLTLFKISTINPLHSDKILTLQNLYHQEHTAFLILSALILYSAAILLYSLTRGLSYVPHAITGLILISLMVFYGLTSEPTPQTISLWISGWSLFSVFWIKSYCRTHKSYTLYQCE